MKSWHKTTAVALLGVALALAGAFTARRMGRPSSEDIFNRVSDRIGCQCGCNQPLSGCNHHPCGSADPMRAQIRTMISSGKDEQAIVAAFVSEYGQKVLSAPPAEGFNVTAWVMPFAALLAGLIFVAWLIRHMQQRAAGAATPAAVALPPEKQQLVDRYARQIDEELEREP